MQKRHNSSVLAMELHLFWIQPTIGSSYFTNEQQISLRGLDYELTNQL